MIDKSQGNVAVLQGAKAAQHKDTRMGCFTVWSIFESLIISIQTRYDALHGRFGAQAPTASIRCSRRTGHLKQPQPEGLIMLTAGGLRQLLLQLISRCTADETAFQSLEQP